jgi:hypothetical protein
MPGISLLVGEYSEVLWAGMLTGGANQKLDVAFVDRQMGSQDRL